MDSLEPTFSKVLCLDDAQELRLKRERHVRDLVQEQRPAVGKLEAAPSIGQGIGEGALDVAEELRFEQGFRYGGAVDPDERLRAAGTGQVDLLGKELLADTGFAEKEDGGIGLRGLARDGELLLDEPALSDERVVPLPRLDLILQHAELVADFLEGARVLHGNCRLRREDLQPLKVLLCEGLSVSLVDDLDDPDELVLHAHGRREDGGGGEADLLGDIGVKALVIADVIHDQRGVFLRHPPGNPLSHVHRVLLDAGTLRPQRDLEVQLVVLRVDEHERGCLPLGQLRG